MWFEAVFCLRIKIEKSELILIGEAISMEGLALVLGCRVRSLPATYLGLLLGAPHKSLRVWDLVEERFQR